MNYKPYSENIWSFIESEVDRALKQKKTDKLIAAFDADGTLWDCDLGENYFRYQIDHQLVPLPNDPFNYYLQLKEKNNDPRDAFIWLAQISEGVNLAVTEQWSELAFKEIQPSPLFSEQKKLIQFLFSKNIEIFIVTASVKQAVIYGASLFGIDSNHVIGVETEIVNNIITNKPVYPVTYRQGKVEALLKKTNGEMPFLASGNTMGDFELLQSATHVKLAVSAAAADDKIYRTEMELQSNAKKFDWLNHRFI